MYGLKKLFRPDLGPDQRPPDRYTRRSHNRDPNIPVPPITKTFTV
jgi:hypothetical protein